MPFRLTRDIIDGMGVTGVEGVFRKCCEETLSVMRTNKEALLTIIEVWLSSIMPFPSTRTNSFICYYIIVVVVDTDMCYRFSSMTLFINGLSRHWRLCSGRRYTKVLMILQSLMPQNLRIFISFKNGFSFSNYAGPMQLLIACLICWFMIGCQQCCCNATCLFKLKSFYLRLLLQTFIIWCTRQILTHGFMADATEGRGAKLWGSGGDHATGSVLAWEFIMVHHGGSDHQFYWLYHTVEFSLFNA